MVVIYVFFAFICKKNNKNFAVQKLITNFAIRTNLLTFVKKCYNRQLCHQCWRSLGWRGIITVATSFGKSHVTVCEKN